MGGNFLPFKGVINGKEGSLIAKVNLTDSSIAIDSLVFKTSAGAKIQAKRIANTNDFELTVKGMQSNAIEEVQASIKQGEKYKVAGAFKLVHMNTHTVELRLVPTSSSIDINKVMKSLINLN
ncbi:MAG: hypothetical protein LBE34_14255 [Flavobacteriaceae bacterium]|nr:hypothetical protein [Flavobacteriaceae bacterium]